MSFNIDALVDREQLARWLNVHVPALGTGEVHVAFLHGGTSNIILRIVRGGKSAVLRRPPPLPPPNSGQSIAREARILRALDRTRVAHPRLYGYCSDAATIGAPFYLMECVDGWAPELTGQGCFFPPAFDSPRARREIGFAAIDELAQLAVVDHRGLGLGDFGRPGNFLGRQVDRWLGQLQEYPKRYRAYQPRTLPFLDEVSEWLRRNVPASYQEGIVHGDFGPPNILFAHERPARVLAIVDWELATIGDPRLDLALFSCNLRDDAAPDVVPAAAYFDSRDFPTRQEVIARYGERTGFDMSGIGYHLVLAQFRMACILEYKVAAAAGAPMLGRMAIFPDMVTNLMKQAHAMIRGL